MNTKPIALLLAIAASANTYSNDNQNIREILAKKAAIIKKIRRGTLRSEGLTLENTDVLKTKRDLAIFMGYGIDHLMDICDCMDERNSHTINDAYSCNEKPQTHADCRVRNQQYEKLVRKLTKEYLDYISSEIQAQKQ